MTNVELTLFESEVLRWLLKGEDPVLAALRQQLVSVSILSRKLTGHGFYVCFAVPEGVGKLHQEFRVKADFSFGDVHASVDSLQHGAGFLLWIKDGVLDALEGYTYDESWPTNIEGFELEYVPGSNRDLHQLRRHWELDKPCEGAIHL